MVRGRFRTRFTGQWRQGFFRIIKNQRGGGDPSPKTPSPPPQTKVTIVGKNEIYNRENLVRPFLVHQVLGPKPPPPLPRPCSKEALTGGVSDAEFWNAFSGRVGGLGPRSSKWRHTADTPPERTRRAPEGNGTRRAQQPRRTLGSARHAPDSTAPTRPIRPALRHLLESGGWPDTH